MVVAALRAGKHVVCEKPLTSSLALADAIAAEEKRSPARIMPIFQCRFGDGIARVRHVIQSGLAGRHYLASIDTAKKRGADYYATEWRGKFATELGGVLATQAIHIHDLVFWLLGAPRGGGIQGRASIRSRSRIARWRACWWPTARWSRSAPRSARRGRPGRGASRTSRSRSSLSMTTPAGRAKSPGP
jgi:predicted dehydrogenase